MFGWGNLDEARCVGEMHLTCASLSYFGVNLQILEQCVNMRTRFSIGVIDNTVF